MYGESVFTTLLMIDGNPVDWGCHLERLKKGVEFIYGPFLNENTGEDWRLIFRDLIEEKLFSLSGNRTVRVAVFREQSRGLSRRGLLSIHHLKIQIHSEILDEARFENKMISLRTCPVTEKPHWWPSYLKAGNYLDTIVKQKMYLKPDDDDLLFLSSEDTVLESSVANIFCIKRDKLYTPPAGPNVLAGIMRDKVIQCAESFFREFEEAETSLEQLCKADAIFGTNSIRGPFLIKRVDDYEIEVEASVLKKFQDLRKEVFPL